MMVRRVAELLSFMGLLAMMDSVRARTLHSTTHHSTTLVCRCLPSTVITVIVLRRLRFVHTAAPRADPMPATASAPLANARPTLAAHVVGRLRGLLIEGVLSPGEKVSLRTVADRLGVSMTPVREAVAQLIADRALEVLPNRAVRVPVMSLRQFRELTAIRIAIEGFATERAARERTAADLAALHRHDAAFRRQCGRRQPDPVVAVRANAAFHFAVYAAAGLPTLLPIIQGLWLRVGPVLNLDMRSSAARLVMGGAERCHADLLAAIEHRRARTARAALTRDIRHAAAYIESRGVLPVLDSARRRALH
jgi:DNA-binding GntR family transcriptional regulator